MKPNGESVPKTRKSKKKPPTPHPWEDNPGDYFNLFGAILVALPGNKEADRIIDEYDLNRPSLIVSRVEYFKDIKKFIDLWTEETDTSIKKFIRNRIFEYIDRKKEFSFFGREFVKSLNLSIK